MGISRAGLLGGTFDPIHHGHLVAGQEVLYRLKLDVVYFMPAGSPPHKVQSRISSTAQRIEMVQLAICDHAGFELCRVDVDRPGPSYTVDTLELLKSWWPDTELYFIMGMDSLADFIKWQRPGRILELANLAVVSRPHYQADLQTLEASLPGLAERLYWVPMPWLEISSSDLQRRVREGAPIRYLVPPVVEQYIYKNGLYK